MHKNPWNHLKFLHLHFLRLVSFCKVSRSNTQNTIHDWLTLHFLHFLDAVTLAVFVEWCQPEYCEMLCLCNMSVEFSSLSSFKALMSQQLCSNFLFIQASLSLSIFICSFCYGRGSYSLLFHFLCMFFFCVTFDFASWSSSWTRHRNEDWLLYFRDSNKWYLPICVPLQIK